MSDALRLRVIDLTREVEELRNAAADWKGLYLKTRSIVAGECAFLAERCSHGVTAAAEIRRVFKIEE